MRRAVSRAAPLAYQHSRIILPITRSAWARNNGKGQCSALPLAPYWSARLLLCLGTDAASTPPKIRAPLTALTRYLLGESRNGLSWKGP